MRFIEKIALEGGQVTLTPLELHHKDALLSAAADGELWRLWYTSVPSSENIDEYIGTAISEFSNATGLAFAIIDKSNNSVIGTTRYTNTFPQDRRLEIGYTWYAKSYQRTGINTKCKYLLLCHAFEQLHCIAVEFRTHRYNFASRNAILRLGAIQDGILRSHKLMKDNSKRDTVVFSITAEEWPTCKTHLEYLMYNKYRDRG